MRTIIYILSLSFQVAGALLLLFFAKSTKRENVVRNFVGNGIIKIDNNTMELDYDTNAFKENYRVAYLNKFAFLYIAIGYILGVFGCIEWKSKIVVAILIIFGTIIIMVITYACVNCLIKYLKDSNKKITNEELMKFGIKPNIGTISFDKIDAFFAKKKD